MNSEVRVRQDIENALKDFLDEQIPLREAATHLLNTLGYRSQRVGNDAIDSDRYDRLVESALGTENTSDRTRINDWVSFYQIMQVTDDEINQQVTPEQGSLFESSGIDDMLRTSYMFVAVGLSEDAYTRTQLADITRFINKAFQKPIMVIFRYGGVLTLAIINRRPNLRDSTKQVLEKVTLIKDIKLDDPKRAHIDIVSDLYLRRLIVNEGVNNFDTLHKAWEVILNTEPLNRRFYREIYEWYEWAVAVCEFPDEDNDMQVIRMITRLLFIWFLREKDLVPADIFEVENVEVSVSNFSLGTSDYYQAVLQNLFFATLNTPIDEREFSTRDARSHRDASKYRYADLLQDPNGFLEHLKEVPFVNGGLFDCLDTFESPRDGGFRIDCFTDNGNDRRGLFVPAKLFYKEGKGIFDIFSHYKFTVEENTPVEQEVALDPELLGQVFENLLGAYNLETRITARSATGSYYTPRQIVNYMVDEVLIAYLLQKVSAADGDSGFLEERLRDDLLAYDQQGRIDTSNDHLIFESEVEQIIEAINDLKIIDPAVGSGAFPMGILTKLVLILRKLDPQNEHWKQRQLAQADMIDDPESREGAIQAIEQVFSEANRYNDYGRKLYLIQNCIYGVDIQPIAITIAKLRFFISLIIEQGTNDDRDANYGIRPLPNLETKFVAANALIGLNELNEPEFQTLLGNEDVLVLRQEIAELRRKHFSANTRQVKLGYMRRERDCREELSETLALMHAAWREQIQNRIEDQVSRSQLSQERAAQLREELQEEYAGHEAILAAGIEEARRIAHWDAYNQNGVAEFFDAEWMFGVSDGFDVVIGNPPYIQLQRDGGRLGRLYQDAGFETFVRTGDIYCLFYEKAHQLLGNRGLVCLITSNKWMRAGYGSRLRDYFVTHTQPVQLLDMGPDVFDATVDTNILLFQNNFIGVPVAFRAVTLGADFDRQTGNISRYLIDNGASMEVPAMGEPWAILSSAEMRLKRKIEEVGIPLRDWDINIYRGITTGCNEAFIIDEAKREEFIEQDPRSAEIIKPLLRGRDIKRYHAKWAKMYLLFIPWHFPLHEDSTITGSSREAENAFEENYPSIFSHLLQYQDRLSNRNRSETGIRYEWYALQRCANTYYTEFDKEKIVWQEIVREGTFSIDRNRFYPEATTFILTGKNLTYLLGILNSKFFLYAFKNYYAGGHLGSTGIRFKRKFIESSPIPPITEENQGLVTEIENKVDDILAVKAADPEADTTELENEIDCLVYGLYGLTDDEIAIVEGRD